MFVSLAAYSVKQVPKLFRERIMTSNYFEDTNVTRQSSTLELKNEFYSSFYFLGRFFSKSTTDALARRSQADSTGENRTKQERANTRSRRTKRGKGSERVERERVNEKDREKREKRVLLEGGS